MPLLECAPQQLLVRVDHQMHSFQAKHTAAAAAVAKHVHAM
jgi:hypothetical protein